MTVWSNALQCSWDCWRADGETTMRLDLPKNNVTDMTGCTRMAMAIMPDVRVINVYVDGTPDIRYTKDGKKWIALDLRQ